MTLDSLLYHSDFNIFIRRFFIIIFVVFFSVLISNMTTFSQSGDNTRSVIYYYPKNYGNSSGNGMYMCLCWIHRASGPIS